MTSFTETGGETYSTLQASNGGTVDVSKLASMSSVTLNDVGPTSVLKIGSLASYNTGNLTVSGGASLSLPGITSYTGNTATTALEATGTGSSLTLANLATVTEGSNAYPAWTEFEALAGGTVTLSGLKTINTGTVILEADGANSTLNVPALTSFTETGGGTYSTLQASNGGDRRRQQTGHLVERHPQRRWLDLGPEDRQPGVVQHGNLTVSGGASLSLPGITSYTGNTATTALEATGTGSSLTLANLATVTEASNAYPAWTEFEALAGGTRDLSGLKTINTGTVILEADGTGSTLNVPALTGFTEANGETYSTLQASNGGTVDVSKLTALSNVDLNYAGSTSDLKIGSLTSYNTGNLTVSGGASLSLPGITSYTGNTATTALEATGTGSSLTLANLATVTEASNAYPAWTEIGPGRRHRHPLGTQDHQHRHGDPGGRRHRQHAERPVLDQLHRGQRLRPTRPSRPPTGGPSTSASWPACPP